jgi:hypothetical protein
LSRYFSYFAVALLLLLPAAATPVLAAGEDKEFSEMQDDVERPDDSRKEAEKRNEARRKAAEMRELRGVKEEEEKKEEDKKSAEMHDDDKDSFGMHDDLRNKYDGSQFDKHSFIDSSFEKDDYRGGSRVSKMMEDASKERDELMKKEEEKKKKKMVAEKDDDDDDDGDYKKLDPRNIGDMLGQRSGPVHDLPGDWVPDKIDLTANGGFEISPDNGSPVPYRLNGHIDIQRGRPWKDSDN